MVDLFVVAFANARLRQRVFASALSAGGRLALGRFENAFGTPRTEWSWQLL